MDNTTISHIFKGNRGKIIDLLMIEQDLTPSELQRRLEQQGIKLDYRAIWQHLEFLKRIGIVSFKVLKKKKGKPKQIIFNKNKFEEIHKQEITKAREFFIKNFSKEKRISVLKLLNEKGLIKREQFNEELYKQNFDSMVSALVLDLIGLGYIDDFYRISEEGKKFLKENS